jgi:hypothetical protein
VPSHDESTSTTTTSAPTRSTHTHAPARAGRAGHTGFALTTAVLRLGLLGGVATAVLGGSSLAGAVTAVSPTVNVATGSAATPSATAPPRQARARVLPCLGQRRPAGVRRRWAAHLGPVHRHAHPLVSLVIRPRRSSAPSTTTPPPSLPLPEAGPAG